MRPDRRGLWLVLVVLALAPGVALGASPSVAPASAPSPSPVATPAWPPPPGDSSTPGGLPWQPVSLDLAEGRWLSQFATWAGGLAALEKGREDDRTYAVWTSVDGLAWQRSRVGRAMRDAWRLVPFQDGLYLFTPAGRQDFGSISVAMRTWRSDDGSTWRRAGDFRWSLPERYEGIWRTSLSRIGATPERLVLLVVIDGCCGSGGSVPARARFASLIAAAPARVPHQGLAIWTSTTGARWERGSNEAFRAADGQAWIDDLRQVPGALMAVREGSHGLLESTDGVEWTTRGSLPSNATWYGSQGLTETDGSLMVAADDEGPGSRAVGNRLGVWRMEPDGSWTRTIDIQPAFTHSLMAVGRTVIVAGGSWGRGPDRWPWIKVSLDGGRTWDDRLSWTGAPGACFSDLVALGQRVVMRDCSDGEVTLWVTDLPVSEVVSSRASPGT